MATLHSPEDLPKTIHDEMLGVDVALTGVEDVRQRQVQTLLRSTLQKQQETTSSKKWWTAIVFAILFAIIASSTTTHTTTTLTEYLKLGPTYNCDGFTPLGLFLHAFIFFVILRWILN
jgi:hypothetical protein